MASALPGTHIFKCLARCWNQYIAQRKQHKQETSYDLLILGRLHPTHFVHTGFLAGSCRKTSSPHKSNPALGASFLTGFRNFRLTIPRSFLRGQGGLQGGGRGLPVLEKCRVYVTSRHIRLSKSKSPQPGPGHAEYEHHTHHRLPLCT